MNEEFCHRLRAVLFELTESNGQTFVKLHAHPLRFSEARLIALERLQEAIFWLELDNKAIQERHDAEQAIREHSIVR